MSEPLRLAVLGDPIEHSRSPAIHTAAMRHLGIDGTFVAVKAGPVELDRAIEDLREGRLDGMNVTMPLKRQAAIAADTLTAEAEESGSVNTLRLRDGAVEGHSTDVIAVRSALADPRFGQDAPVLVLGSGGAAAAALVAARGRVVYLSARSEPDVAALVSLITPAVNTVAPGTAVAGAIVVNATPLGMRGEYLPPTLTTLASGIIDLPYGDEPTPTVLWAIEKGLPVMDGVEFLVLQAAASFQWWTGLEAPLQVMLEAARKT
jgi:shikimate dehydrogenase